MAKKSLNAWAAAAWMEKQMPGSTFLAYTHKPAAKAFMEAVHLDQGDYPCEHGHLGCSTQEGGPCQDEVLSNFPELNDE